MASFKESITKGITTLNVKTSSFMEESKCKTYISTLENEIKDLKFMAGEKAFEMWGNNENYAEGIKEILEQINAKYQEIEAQKERMAQIAQEGQQILGTYNQQSNYEAEVSSIYCSWCGAENDVTYKFCRRCGKPLNQ